MKIPVLAHSRNSELDHIKTALAILNTSQAKYFYDLRMDDRVPVNGSAIDQHKVRSDLIGRSEELKNAAIITDVPFQNNWFSVTSRGGTIITIHSWDEHFSPPAVKTFILMELILHTAAVTGYLTDGLMERMAHQNPIGCLFDFCIDKREVKFKLVGGHLCGSCADTLIRHKANSDDVFAIRKMLDAMRLDSIGRAPQVDLNKVFVAMRFTANDENDNAYQYGVVPAFESRGLSIDRADSKPSSDFLIKKIFTMIDESWAVIVLGGGSESKCILRIWLRCWTRKAYLYDKFSVRFRSNADGC